MFQFLGKIAWGINLNFIKGQFFLEIELKVNVGGVDVLMRAFGWFLDYVI